MEVYSHWIGPSDEGFAGNKIRPNRNNNPLPRPKTVSFCYLFDTPNSRIGSRLAGVSKTEYTIIYRSSLIIPKSKELI